MVSLFRTGQRLWFDFQGKRVSSRVQSIDGDLIIINPGMDITWGRGNVIPVCCSTPTGFAVYWMQVVHPANSVGRNAVLRRNPNAGGNFNRRGWRVAVSLPGAVRRVGAPHYIDGRVVNLSMEGALVVSQASFSSGDIIDLRLSVPDSIPCLLTARVCRTIPFNQEGKPPESQAFGAGLFFLEVPRETRTMLTCFLWKSIRELHSVQPRRPRKFF